MNPDETLGENSKKAEEIDDRLAEAYGELLDVNRDILDIAREHAKGMLELREVYLEQVRRCEEIAVLHIKGAQVVGDTFGDILANEWGLSIGEEDNLESEGDEE